MSNMRTGTWTLKRLRFLLGFMIGPFVSVVANAQDPHFSNMSYVPLYVNPASAGDTCGRASLVSRSQWDGLTGNYNTYSGSVDAALKFKPDMRPFGFGLYSMYDTEGHGVLSTYRIGTALKFPAIRLHKRTVLCVGAGFSYSSRNLDQSKLTFRDEIDPERGFVYRTNENFIGRPTDQYGFTFGLMVRMNRSMRIGASLDHAFHTETNFVGGAGQTPTRVVLHTNGQYGIGGASVASPSNGSRLRYELILQSQARRPTQLFSGFWQFGACGEYRYGNKLREVGVGIQYRHKDAVVLKGTFRIGPMETTVAYDITTTRIRSTSTHSFELGLCYYLRCTGLTDCADPDTLKAADDGSKARDRGTDKKEDSEKKQGKNKKIKSEPNPVDF